MNIGLQLWSIFQDFRGQFEFALELAQKAGYQSVELAGGVYGDTPAHTKQLLEKYNLKPVGAHVGLGRFENNFDEELDFAVKVGYDMIVCPGMEINSKDDVLRAAAILEACAQKAAKEGVGVGYHIHSNEFVKFDGKYAIDILLENAPSIKLQPDVFWIVRGGVDPVSYLKQFENTGRICNIHAKEISADGTSNAYIGQGVIDFKGIAKMFPPCTYTYIVEQEEYSGDHLEGLIESYKGMKEVVQEVPAREGV